MCARFRPSDATIVGHAEVEALAARPGAVGARLQLPLTPLGASAGQEAVAEDSEERTVWKLGDGAFVKACNSGIISTSSRR